MNTDAEQVVRLRAFEDAIRLVDASWPGDVPSTELATFLAQSSAHIEEALQAACIWQRIMALSADQFDEIELLARELQAAEACPGQFIQLVPPQSITADTPGALRKMARACSLRFLRAIRFPSRGRLNGLWRVALAAALSALVLQLDSHPPVQSSALDLYQTSVGEHRLLTLTDGSTIHLNTRSCVSVRFSATRRAAQLLQGEALFTIQHDATRPFEVVSGVTVVRDVGTQFNVHRKTSDATVVTVIEGQVDVSLITDLDNGQPLTRLKGISLRSGALVRIPARLGKGEQVTVGFHNASAYAEGHSMSEDEIARKLAWREGRITFAGEPMKQVADEFSRYNNVRFLIGPETSNILLGGQMAATDVAGFLEFLRMQYGVRIRSELDASGVRIITLTGSEEGIHWRPHTETVMPSEHMR